MLKEELQGWSVEELEELKAYIEQLIKEKTTPPGEYEFSFHVTIDPRKGHPYVAKLSVDNEGKVQRTFYDLDRIYGKKEVTAFGTFRAREGDIIEQRTGASWKNDYRSWYAVVGGKLVEVATIGDSVRKALVMRYLKGEIPLAEILPNEKGG